MPESTPVNLMDLYDTDSDSDSEIERPTYSPLSSGSSVEATSDYDGEDDDGDGDDGLSSNGDTTNDVSDAGDQFVVLVVWTPSMWQHWICIDNYHSVNGLHS